MIGQTVSHYKIQEKLGEGGMGVVYKALDTTLDRHVAIKFLPAGFESEENARERFVREAKAASALNHSNIAVVHEIDQAPDGRMFIVMAYYDGETLKDRLGRGALPVEEAVEIVARIASGLAKAHEKNILHRDIKPANVLLTEDGEPKLADFGLAKVSGQETLTETGTTLGTLSYMSPEQAKGGEAGRPSDVFSLGVVLYELLTGRQPFVADQEAALLYRIVNDEPEPLKSHRPDLEQDLQHIVDKALAKDPDDRYPSARELLGDLKHWQAGKQIARPRRKRRRVQKKTLVWAVVAVAVVAGLYAISTRLPAPQPKEPKIASLAVLPFRFAAADSERVFLAESITAEVIARLSQVKSIKVIARRSVLGYTNTDKSLAEIAAELGVEALVEGSVRIVDDRLRVTAELADTNESDALWGNVFDKKYDEALALSGEIALAVARAAGVGLTQEQESRMGIATPVDPAVLKAYRIGRQALETWGSDEAWLKGIKKFNEAIDLDPDFAPAYAGLSRCHGYMGWFYTESDHDAIQLEAALKAVELDGSLAEGYVALADYYYYKALDWDGAEVAFSRALELEPGSALAHNTYGNYLILAGRGDEGIEHMKWAKDLDPLSWAAHRELGLSYLNAHRPEEGIEYLLELRQRFPDKYFTEYFLASCYSATGRHEEAFATLDSLYAGTGYDWRAANPAFLADAGLSDEALEKLKILKEKASPDNHEMLMTEFSVLATLGRYDEAMDAAETLLEASPTLAIFLTVDYVPADFLETPRYQAFLRSLGL